MDEWKSLVLGWGTFSAAEPAWVCLAEAYCQQSREIREELAVYRAACAPDGLSAMVLEEWEESAEDWSVEHMMDDSPDNIKAAGGAMAVFSP